MNKGHGLNTPILLLGDYITVNLCILLAFATRTGLEMWLGLVPLGHGISFYILSKAWIAGVVIVCIAYYGSYAIIMTVWDELLLFFKGLFLSFLVVWVLLSLQKEAETVSRIVITLSFVYMAILLPLNRFLIKWVLFKTLGRRRPAFLFERRKGERRNELKDTLNKVSD